MIGSPISRQAKQLNLLLTGEFSVGNIPWVNDEVERNANVHTAPSWLYYQLGAVSLFYSNGIRR